MKILFVAMANSVHTARWAAQAASAGHELHLFPSMDHGAVHPELEHVRFQNTWYERMGALDRPFVSRGVAYAARRAIARYLPHYRPRRLARVIRALKPDVVHSLEFQSAGYLCLEAYRELGGAFPPWIATNWGSDIYLFGRLAEHREKISNLLAACRFYSCECERDVRLAREFGFRGEVLPVLPNSGGFDMDEVLALRAPGPSSQRREIVIKGYQHWAGRALVALRALERCADALHGYTVNIFSAGPEVQLAAELFSESTGVPVNIVPGGASHRDMLALHGRARISIGLSISDAISTPMLEALVMGSLPIQSRTACANEWVEDGRTGLLVPPEDPEEVELAIRRALQDDRLVDTASEQNLEMARQRLDRDVLLPKVHAFYGQVRDSLATGHGGR